MNFKNDLKQINWRMYIQGLSPLGYSFFHLGLLFILYQVLVLGSFIHSFDIYHFLQWDAHWYAGIAKNGYQFSESEQSNTAFFPLFPFVWKVLWKISNAGVGQVCAFNTLLFLLGMTILKKTFNFSWMYFLVFVSIPSNMFMYVPYSEALFFFFSSILLAGFKLDSKKLIVFGLFFASLTRPSATFFIPAIVLMELMVFETYRTFFKRVIWLSLIPLLSFFILVIYQYIKTGYWLAYFTAQAKFWNRTFQIPEFPLTTWDGSELLWLDGFAFFFGLLATCLLAIYILKKYFTRNFAPIEKTTIFSITYLSLSFFSVLLFNGKDALGGTSLMGLNRYILANPFFIVFLFFLSHHLKLNFKTIGIFLLILIGSLFAFNFDGSQRIEYDSNQKMYYALLMFCHSLSYTLLSSKYKGKFLAMIYVMNVCIQLFLLAQFANGRWVG